MRRAQGLFTHFFSFLSLGDEREEAMMSAAFGGPVLERAAALRTLLSTLWPEFLQLAVPARAAVAAIGEEEENEKKANDTFGFVGGSRNATSISTLSLDLNLPQTKQSSSRSSLSSASSGLSSSSRSRSCERRSCCSGAARGREKKSTKSDSSSSSSRREEQQQRAETEEGREAPSEGEEGIRRRQKQRQHQLPQRSSPKGRLQGSPSSRSCTRAEAPKEEEEEEQAAALLPLPPPRPPRSTCPGSRVTGTASPPCASPPMAPPC